MAALIVKGKNPMTTLINILMRNAGARKRRMLLRELDDCLLMNLGNRRNDRRQLQATLSRGQSVRASAN